jgi:hypothetical protein
MHWPPLNKLHFIIFHCYWHQMNDFPTLLVAYSTFYPHAKNYMYIHFNSLTLSDLIVLLVLQENLSNRKWNMQNVLSSCEIMCNVEIGWINYLKLELLCELMCHSQYIRKNHHIGYQSIRVKSAIRLMMWWGLVVHNIYWHLFEIYSIF